MYSIEKYRDIIGDQDADTRKRYEMIEKLSKGFTVENKTALEMDKLLAEQLDLEQDDEPVATSDDTSSVVASKPRARRNNKPSASSDLIESFNELFEALKSKAPQIIRYELPQVTTPNFQKPAINDFQNMVDDLVMGNNVFLVGGAGTGKTYLAENLLAKAALGRQHIIINCSQWTSPTEIIGGQTMDGYVEGKLIEAWHHGYVLILDELPKIDPNTAGLFNDALAKTKIPNAVIFNARKESFAKHNNFACIATGNIYPDKESMSYGANNKQDLSLLDRFSGSVYFVEKNPAIERQIIQNDMLWSICDKMRSGIEELKYEAQLSLRFMQNARDAYLLEMQRVKNNRKDDVKADAGKTFKSSVDSYLSTFTDVQQKNLKDKIRYSEIFLKYEYRNFDKNKMVY
jgi:MoxR-like ATPase